jgi:hypothetical protein
MFVAVIPKILIVLQIIGTIYILHLAYQIYSGYIRNNEKTPVLGIFAAAIHYMLDNKCCVFYYYLKFKIVSWIPNVKG